MGMFGRREQDPLQGKDPGLAKGDRALASCVDMKSAEVLMATTHGLTVLPSTGGLSVHRPWHLVDTGSYDNEADVLSVTWVDRAPDLALHVGGNRPFLQAFRERVQASVVIAESLDLGEGRSAKLVIRKDLAADRLLDQVVLGRGVRLADPGVREQVMAARASLREQVGLD